MKQLVVLLNLLWSVLVIGQPVDTVSYGALIQIVLEQHPVIYQSELLTDQSRAYLGKARGHFDPVLKATFDQKRFDQKNYYQNLNSSLEIPTWLGPSVKVGYERNQGDFLNNADLLPPNGLINAGIKIPLGSGLIFDERRKAVAEARLIGERNTLKQKLIINKLIFEASKAFLAWQTAYQKVRIQEDAILVAEERYESTVLSFLNGDKPAIDTVEALISFRQRQQELINFQQEFRITKELLDNYLWLEGRQPMQLDSTAVPELMPNYSNETSTLRLQWRENLLNNPELQFYQLDQEQLNLDRRLNREFLKPEVNFTYNPLLRVNQENLLSFNGANEYKIGVDFYFPLFTRKARAEQDLIDLNLQDNALQIDYVQEQLVNDFEQLFASDELLEDQLDIIASNIVDQTRLLDAENEKFRIGESSLFLVTSRESKLLDLKVKEISAQKDLTQNRLDLMMLSFSFTDEELE